MKKPALFLGIALLAGASLPGRGWLIRESNRDGYMEIAAPVKGDAGRVSKLKYMIKKIQKGVEETDGLDQVIWEIPVYMFFG